MFIAERLGLTVTVNEPDVTVIEAEALFVESAMEVAFRVTVCGEIAGPL